MFREFFLDAYKRIYGYYHDRVELIIHHNDSYSATLVPTMIPGVYEAVDKEIDKMTEELFWTEFNEHFWWICIAAYIKSYI